MLGRHRPDVRCNPHPFHPQYEQSLFWDGSNSMSAHRLCNSTIPGVHTSMHRYPSGRTSTLSYSRAHLGAGLSWGLAGAELGPSWGPSRPLLGLSRDAAWAQLGPRAGPRAERPQGVRTGMHRYSPGRTSTLSYSCTLLVAGPRAQRTRGVRTGMHRYFQSDVRRGSGPRSLGCAAGGMVPTGRTGVGKSNRKSKAIRTLLAAQAPP